MAMRKKNTFSPHRLPRTDLHAEGEDGDDDLEDESEGELPQGVVDPGPRRPVWDVVHRSTHVGVIDVITELRRLQSAAVVEELGDELAGAAAGVRVGVRQHSGDPCDGDDLQDRVLPQLGGLPPPAPGDIGPDEESPPEAAEHAQQDEGDQLGHVPRRVVLDVEQHQTAVAKRVDGAQREGSDQSSEERTPQSLQREIITDLQEGGRTRDRQETSGFFKEKNKRTGGKLRGRTKPGRIKAKTIQRVKLFRGRGRRALLRQPDHKHEQSTVSQLSRFAGFITNLLQAEQNSSDGRSKGHRHSSCCCR